MKGEANRVHYNKRKPVSVLNDEKKTFSLKNLCYEHGHKSEMTEGQCKNLWSVRVKVITASNKHNPECVTMLYIILQKAVTSFIY